MNPQIVAEEYQRWRLALCRVNGKRPCGQAWQSNPVAPEGFREGDGIGLIHGLSDTSSIDVDDLERSRLVFEQLGIDVDELCKQVHCWTGHPDRRKLLFLIPEAPNLSVRKLTVGGDVIFELRGNSNPLSGVMDVLPPSVHPGTGQPYKWLHKPESEFQEPPSPLIKIWQNWDQWEPKLQRMLGVESEQLGDVNAAGKAELKLEATATGVLLKPARVRSALRHIPTEGYDTWLRVGLALYHMSGGAEVALALWDQWSQGGSTYKQNECLEKWKTFGRDGGQVVTEATIFYLAREGGWDGKARCGTPEDRGWIAEERRLRIADFDQHHGLVVMGGTHAIARRKLDHGVREMMTTFESQKGIIAVSQPDPLPKLMQKKEDYSVEHQNLAALWFNMPGRRTYPDGVHFLPRAGMYADDSFGLPDGDSCNLYLGLRTKPVKDADCSLVLDHIRDVLCAGDEEGFEYVLHWMARMFQYPADRGHTALVFKGGEGHGKNIVWDMLVKLFGAHGLTVNQMEQVVGRFASHLATAVLVVLNESVFGGDKRHAGRLKGLITDEEHLFERKYVDATKMRSSIHLVVLSNEEWAVHVDWDDRRVVMFDTSDHRRDDFDYFTKLRAWIEDGGDAKFLGFLLARDISDFNPRKLPKGGAFGAAKAAHKLRSASPAERWWYQLLQDGQDAVQSGTFEETQAARWKDGLGLEISGSELRDCLWITARSIAG